MNFLTRNIRKISISAFAAVVIIVMCFSFYGKDATKSVFVFDTLTDISLSGRDVKKNCDAIASLLRDMEQTYSKYIPDSEIAQFNSLSDDEQIALSHDTAELISRSIKISNDTDGAFDVTTSKLSDLWQVKEATTPPTKEEIEKALENTGYEKIILTENALVKSDVDIDLGGILKGYAADKIRQFAAENDIKSGIVNLGGNVCLIGSNKGKPWRIGITNPFSPGEVYLTLDLEDTNIITSGAYQRYFEHGGKIYHHILSPRTGYPAETDIASATVISKDGTLADALSTAIFVLGSEKGLEIAKNCGVHALIIKTDGSVIATEGLKYKIQ